MAEKHPKRPTDEAIKAKALSRWEGEGGAPPRKPKRPRDLNQWAKHIVDVATGEAAESDPDAGKDPAAVRRGRAGGKKGGNARAMKLTPEQRGEIARIAAQTRWKKSP